MSTTWPLTSMKPGESKVSVVNFFPFFTFEMKATEASSSTNLSNIKNDLIIFCPSMIEPSAYRACVRGSSVPTSQLHWFIPNFHCRNACATPASKVGADAFVWPLFGYIFFQAWNPLVDGVTTQATGNIGSEQSANGENSVRLTLAHHKSIDYLGDFDPIVCQAWQTHLSQRRKNKINNFTKIATCNLCFFSLLCPQQLLACYRFARMFNWKCLKCWLKCWRAVLVSIWVGALTRVPCRYRWNKKSHSKIPKHGSKSKLSIRKRQAVKRIKDLKDIKQAVA